MTNPSYQSPTIHDVARLAGVSISTVSKALSGKGQLREETRQHVRLVAEQIGFQPNSLAQSLHRQHTFTVGLITTDSYGRFSMPLLEGIEDALGDARFNVFLCNAADNSERERQHIQSLLAKRVDGIIVTARKTDPRPPIDLGQANLPVLYAYACANNAQALSLLPDDQGGGQLAMQHLIDLGHHNVACLTGPARFKAVQERLSGARRAAEAAGLNLPESHVHFGEWSEAWGHQAFARVLELGVSAVLCGNDQIARGLCDAAREQGMQIPSQLSVVGFDNWEVMAAATRPPLTSVDMNLHELGHQAAQLLLGMIGGHPAHGQRHLPCRLVVRESTAPPAQQPRPEPPA